MGRKVKVVMTLSVDVVVWRECDAVCCCRLAALYWSNVLPLFLFFHTELWSETLLPVYKLCMLQSSQLSLSFPLCIPLLCHIHPLQIMKLLIMHCPPVPSSSLCPNVFLSTVFSVTVSLCFSVYMTDQVSHTYKTAGKILFPYIYIYIYIYVCVNLYIFM